MKRSPPPPAWKSYISEALISPGIEGPRALPHPGARGPRGTCRAEGVIPGVAGSHRSGPRALQLGPSHPPPPKPGALRGSPRRWARSVMGDARDLAAGLGLWFPEEGAPGLLVIPGLREPNTAPHRPWHWPERAQKTLGCPWSPLSAAKPTKSSGTHARLEEPAVAPPPLPALFPSPVLFHLATSLPSFPVPAYLHLSLALPVPPC